MRPSRAGNHGFAALPQRVLNNNGSCNAAAQVPRPESFPLNLQAIFRRRRVRLVLASAAAAAAIALAGCNVEDIQISEKHLQPIPAETVALMERRAMTKEAPILIRVFKEESELELWKQDHTGQFALLKTYPICRWSGELGPKVKQGDRQAPEGFYTINPAQMNPNSQYYLSFNMGFPNAYDRAHGRTGAHLMVHGNCSSAGCYSMTDEQIGEIFAIGRDAFFGGQKSFQVQAYPFRMTALNMAKHRNSPHFAFWKMLKQGNDHFEVTRQQPKVDVCEKRYVFNAGEPANMSIPLKFDPVGRCPAYEVSDAIEVEVAAKQKADEAQFAQLVRRGTPTVPVIMGQDGGMHPSFLAKLNPQHVRDAKGNVRWVVENPPIGTAKAIVHPVRETDAAPVMVAAAASSSVAEPAVTAAGVADVPLPRPGPRRPTAVAAADSQASGGSGNMFHGLFANSTGTVGSSFSTATSSVVRALGFGKEEPKPQPTQQPIARPAPKPAPGATTIAKREAPQREAPKQEQPKQTADATPPAKPAAAASLMTGAQPTLPAGNFESRFNAFR
jgi:murein L,D-transpeptidase YafK